MLMDPDMRRGEMAVAVPAGIDAGLVFIGRVRTPWATHRECPRRGHEDGPVCRLEFFEPWHEALLGTEAFTQLEVLYWLHQSRRDLVLQSPANDGRVHGTFALRSPVRPNPIGTSIVTLLAREGPALLVRGLDCVDGTPLLDVKPARFLFAPLALPKPGVA